MFDTQTVNPANIVRVDIEDNNALYAAYMPFITNGGIFVGLEQLGGMTCALGTDIYLLLCITTENDRLPVHGRTVWIAGQNSRHTPGIGVQFNDDGETQRRMENLLIGQLESDKPTLTL